MRRHLIFAARYFVLTHFLRCAVTQACSLFPLSFICSETSILLLTGPTLLPSRNAFTLTKAFSISRFLTSPAYCRGRFDGARCHAIFDEASIAIITSDIRFYYNLAAILLVSDAPTPPILSLSIRRAPRPAHQFTTHGCSPLR